MPKLRPIKIEQTKKVSTGTQAFREALQRARTKIVGNPKKVTEFKIEPYKKKAK
jgi:hypothetical protein